jgi:hypothetical protein
MRTSLASLLIRSTLFALLQFFILVGVCFETRSEYIFPIHLAHGLCHQTVRTERNGRRGVKKATNRLASMVGTQVRGPCTG